MKFAVVMERENAALKAQLDDWNESMTTGEFSLQNLAEDGDRSKVITGKCWSTPVLSNGLVLARSTKEAICLDVRSR